MEETRLFYVLYIILTTILVFSLGGLFTCIACWLTEPIQILNDYISFDTKLIEHWEFISPSEVTAYAIFKSERSFHLTRYVAHSIYRSPHTMFHSHAISFSWKRLLNSNLYMNPDDGHRIRIPYSGELSFDEFLNKRLHIQCEEYAHIKNVRQTP